MINLSRARLASGVTVVSLGALTAVALASQGAKPKPATEGAAQVDVRTVIVHRTVKVMKVRKPKTVAGPAPAPAKAASASPTYSSYVAPTTTGGSSTPPARSRKPISSPAPTQTTPTQSPAPTTPTPVQSQPSGSGGGGYGEGHDGHDGRGGRGDD